MQAELNREGKVMMCEACDHVFHFHHRPGSLQDCPSCKVTLYRARSNDFIATKHVYAERRETPQLAEVIRPRFEKKLLFTEVLEPEKKPKSKRPASVKVCEKCYSIQDLKEGEEERACPVCYPALERKEKEVAPVVEKEEELEYVAIDYEESEEIQEEPLMRESVTEEVFPREGEEAETERLKGNGYEVGKVERGALSMPVSYSISTPPLSAHLDFSESASGLAAPIFKKSETELAPAYTQIKLPEITGALVENDLWTNFKKQTFFSQVKDQLNYRHHNPVKRTQSVDVFHYQVRQVIFRYFLFISCITVTLAVITWSLMNTF